MMQHNILLVYLVKQKVGWNILPNPTHSYQSGTVKFSRHWGPTDWRLHQFPDSCDQIPGSPIYKTSPFFHVIKKNSKIGANPSSQMRDIYG